MEEGRLECRQMGEGRGEGRGAVALNCIHFKQSPNHMIKDSTKDGDL